MITYGKTRFDLDFRRHAFSGRRGGNDRAAWRERLARCGIAAIMASLIVLAPVTSATASPSPWTLAAAPLFVLNPVPPNVLIILDNSESMDGTMAGTLVAGSDPTTRGNIGRSIVSNTITNYRTAFNWGLMSYGYSGSPALYNTYAYYLGSSTDMIFTDDCVNGVSATNNNLRCIANPQPFSPGGAYVTYDVSGDDPSINDVLYYGSGSYQPALWGLTAGGTNYNIYTTLSNPPSPSNSPWTSSNFSGGCGSLWGCPWSFTPTDAGFLSSYPPYANQLYKPRNWGYLNNVTGGGYLNEQVMPDSSTHYNNLMTYLGSETNNPSSSEIKNAAVFTPLAGALQNSETYFSSSFQGYTCPITQTCQKNFVILITDGNPTSQPNGQMYPYSQLVPVAGLSGQAAQDAINAVTALRNTTHNSNTYDIQTYVLGLGDTVQNPNSVAVLNAMASAGGTNTAYLATDSASFQQAMGTIATDIISKTGSAAAVATNSRSLSNNTVLYQALFSSNIWSGDLHAVTVNPDGSIGSQLWSAAAQLNGQDWNMGRQIITYNGTQGMPFRWLTSGTPVLSSAEQAALNTNPVTNANDGQGQARLNYLRGDSSNEAPYGLKWRTRGFKLGDIVNSTPVYVGAPPMLSLTYTGDTNQNSTHQTFRSTYVNRPPMIYVGANDGMLHGFDATTGVEKLAYVPSMIYSPNLNQLTNPAYKHNYFVDGSATTNDAYGPFANCGNGSICWRTVLVGSLNGGGKGIYALDVTDPTGMVNSNLAFSEGNATNLVLWEFTGASGGADMGYTYGQPTISLVWNKNDPSGTGTTWAAIFGNGYDSTNGNAVLYVVNIANGSVLAKIPLTSSGSSYNCSSHTNGLSEPAVVDSDADYIADYVYAGDLCGNLWKIDLTNHSPSLWGSYYTKSGTPAPLFTATDTGGNQQVITERPEVGPAVTGQSSGYMVYFGTGHYFATGDNSPSNTPVNSFYGIWDGQNGSLSGSASAAVTRSRLMPQTISETTYNSQTVRYLTNYNITNWSNSGTSCSTSGGGSGNCMGWVDDLLTAQSNDLGEMSVYQSVLLGGVLPRMLFTTLIPQTTACSAGGTGYLMEVNPWNGGQLSTAVFDLNGDGQITSADYVTSSSGATVPVAGINPGYGIMPQPVIVHDSANSRDLKLLTGSSGKVGGVSNYVKKAPGGRMSWRQLY